MKRLRIFFYKKLYTRIFKKQVATSKILTGKIFKIGKHTYGSPAVFFADSGKQLSIGNYCSISKEVIIFLGGNHRTDWVTTYPFYEFRHQFSNGASVTGHPATKGDVIIGNDVWIGHGATILSGITIGDGAVIGAFSVISKDVPAYSIVAGNPMRIIKNRFDDNTIGQLLQIAWWNWGDEKVNANIHLLCNERIQEFISKHQ